MIKEGLYNREEDGNTVISDMTAMPHARLESIKKTVEYNSDENIDLAYSIFATLDANYEFIDLLMLVDLIIQDEELQKTIRNAKIGDEEKILFMIKYVLKPYR